MPPVRASVDARAACRAMDTGPWEEPVDLDASDAALAACVAKLSGRDRARLRTYWSRVIDETCATRAGALPPTPSASDRRRLRCVTRQRRNQLVRVRPAANRTCTEPTPEEGAA